MMLPLHAFYVAACAVVFAVVLFDNGMLLEPAQRRLRDWYRHTYRRELDDQWWWKPLLGCYRCCAGQWANLVYIGRAVFTEAPYVWWEHAAFISLTILFACLLNKAYQWTQS